MAKIVDTARADLTRMESEFAASGRSLGYPDLDRRFGGEIPHLCMARDTADRFAPSIVAAHANALTALEHVRRARANAGPYYQDDLPAVRKVFHRTMGQWRRLRRFYADALAMRARAAVSEKEAA